MKLEIFELNLSSDNWLTAEANAECRGTYASDSGELKAFFFS
jgi:hypothetical protein